MNSTKILFLDIDSVMILHDDHESERERNSLGMLNFDKEQVDSLNRIIQKTQCNIVLSSDWRNGWRLSHLAFTFIESGCISCPIDITPTSKSFGGMDLENQRSHEIELFLNNNPWITSWCAVDDMNLITEKFPFMKGHFSHAFKGGIKSCENEIISILNN